MEEKLKSLFLKLLTAPAGNPAVSQGDPAAFKSLLSHVEETVLKPWSDNQTEFLVLTRFEDDNLNPVNYMSVLSSFRLARGDKTSLEMVKSNIKNHCDQCHPNSPLLMNNLGVMFSENALYEESEDCFNMAKVYCQHQDNIKDAVITLNQGVLKKTLGKYKEAANLATTAASLCDDISMRTTNYAQLPVKLLGRIADILQEFGNHQMLKKILRTAVHFDIPGADEAATAVLSRQLMKIQLEGMDKKIEAKEVKDFISHFLALLAKPDAFKMSFNAKLIRIVIQAAKICRSTGQCKEACELLKKLQSIFLLVHGEDSCLYGSLLYQMGSFLRGSGRFNDAEAALKQAEGILICYCGENHYSVALCRSVLGSCIQLRGNTKDAFEYLKKALTVFKKLNPIHPEVGEIALKFGFFYAEEGNIQQAQETVQEAQAILISSCGEVSCKTANAYFQVGMIFQRFKELQMLAVGKIQDGIEMMVNLGVNVSHPDVAFWRSFLGVLLWSLGMVKEAEKCFIDVQNCVPFCDDVGSKEAEIRTSEDWFLHYRDKADDRSDRSSSVKAQVMDQVMTSYGPLGARDWENEGARPKQVSKKGPSEVVQIASELPVPPFGAFSAESSNDASLSQGGCVERTSTEREQRGQFERKMTSQEWLTREQTARKRDERNDRDMQDAGRRSEEENAAASEQSTESPVFSETSFVEPSLREEETREQVIARSSEQTAREGIKKQAREMKEAGSWPQQGGTTYSQQLHENYDNQSTSSSSSPQSDKITVEDMSFVQQGAFLDAQVTGNRPLGARDWVSEGAKPKQVGKKGRSEVVKIASEPPDPRLGASSVDSSNDSSLSQGRRVERTSRERDQRGQFERNINCREWKIREQRAAKRGVRREKKMQEAQNRSQDENAACPQQLRDQCSLNKSKTQGGIVENIPLSQQDALADAGRPSASTDRERDGLTDEVLARHTQDMSLRGSLNQRIGTDVSLPPDISAQGTSYTDGYFRDSQNRYQSDPVQSAGQNPTLTPGNLNSAADNENATNDPREYILNQSVSVSSTDFALGTGTRRQRPIHLSSSNVDTSAAVVLAQEDVPVDEPYHGGGNITRGAPVRDYVPDSLDITGSLLTWVPHQRDTSQRYSRRVSETWPIS